LCSRTIVPSGDVTSISSSPTEPCSTCTATSRSAIVTGSVTSSVDVATPEPGTVCGTSVAATSRTVRPTFAANVDGLSPAAWCTPSASGIALPQAAPGATVMR
jgi:hypothetical protein